MDRSELSSAGLVEVLRGVLCQVAEPSAVLAAILQQAVTGTGADRGLFVEVSDRGELEYSVLSGFQAGHFEGQAGSFSRNLFARVIETGEDVLLRSAAEDPSFGGAESVQAIGTAAVLCMPIRAGGRIAALVHLEKRQPGRFDEEHRRLLRSLLEVAGPMLEALRAARDMIRDRERLQASEAEVASSREALQAGFTFGRFVGRSPAVRELEGRLRKAAEQSFPVLLLGETGTGKSILARAIHNAGPRARHPMITVSCPSLGRDLVEAELFGHRRGAFTGALSDGVGKVQAAEGGTLFLDEIGELPPEIQPKLLRLLQEKAFERIGDPRERAADVRIIAATNRDLEAEVEQGRFRRDLYERLDFIRIRVPPLRERVEDIGLLLRASLDRLDSGRWIELAPEAVAYLEGLDSLWPGNVRNLEQLAADLVMDGVAGPVSARDLARLLGARERRDGRPGPGPDLEAGLPALLGAAERKMLQEILDRYRGLTREQIAEKLKIAPSTLYKKLREHGLS